MIDEKGRIFGKINLVDLLIILVLIAAAVFLGIKFLGPDSTVATTQKAVVSLYCEEAPDYVVDKLAAGSSVWDSVDNVVIGTLTDWTLSDSVGYLPDTEGESIKYAKDGYHAVTLNCDAEGVIGPYGITIGDTLYGVGHTLTAYAGECKLYLKISDIEPVQ